MKKSEIIEALAQNTGLTKADVEKVYNGTFELFKDELGKGNSVAVSGFGTFKISHRNARKGHNPQTGEAIDIAASNNVSFKAGTDLKKVVNQ